MASRGRYALPRRRYAKRQRLSPLAQRWKGKVVRTQDGRTGHILVDDRDQVTVMWDYLPDSSPVDPMVFQEKGWRVQSWESWLAERHDTFMTDEDWELTRRDLKATPTGQM